MNILNGTVQMRFISHNAVEIIRLPKLAPSFE